MAGRTDDIANDRTWILTCALTLDSSHVPEPTGLGILVLLRRMQRYCSLTAASLVDNKGVALSPVINPNGPIGVPGA